MSQDLTTSELKFLFSPATNQQRESAQKKPDAQAPPLRKGWTYDDYIKAPVQVSEKLLESAQIAPLDSTQNIIDALDELDKHEPATEDTEEHGTDGSQDKKRRGLFGRFFTRPAPETDAGQVLSVRTSPALIIPTGFCNRLALSLDKHSVIALYGPAGCGKTTMLKKQLSSNVALRKKYKTVMHVDCRALRMRNATHLAREMIWAQFGLNESGFTAFYSSLNASDDGLKREKRAHETDPIYAYLRHRFAGEAGIIVLDHANMLNRNGAVSSFLTKSFIPAANELGLKIVISQRSKPTKKQERVLSVGQSIEFPQFTVTEICEWLLEVTETRRGELAFDGKDLFDEIGPRPELLDTFRAYIAHAQNLNRSAVKRFVQHRINFGHIPDCERFVRVARRSPALFHALIVSGGELTEEVIAQMDDISRKRMLESGAVRLDHSRRTAEGELVYSSRLHRERIQILFGSDAFSTLVLRGSEPDILGGGAWAFLKKYREFSSSGIGGAVSSEAEPAMGLKRFQSFLKRWRIDSKLYIRDPENSKLWAPFDKMQALDRFNAWLQPEFARAIQTGASVPCEDGGWFVPVIGHSGLISMVLRVRFETANTEWLERAHLFALECLLEGVTVSLSQVLQRLAFHFERQRISKMSIMSRDGVVGQKGLLQSLSCTGWAILEHNNEVQEWVAKRVETTGLHADSEELEAQLSDVNAAMLEQHAFHKSGRGIVLTNDQVFWTFPNLPEHSGMIFIQRVLRGEDESCVVVFIFDTSTHHAITGVTQKKLGTMATNLAAA